LLLLIGAATFSALGLAVAAVTPSANAAPAVANFVILPLAFISGIFFPLDDAPEWLQTVAGLLPLEPLVSSTVESFNPTIDPGFPWLDIAKLTVWGAIGLMVAIRFFSFEPSTGSGRSRTQPASISD